ncbi:MAG: hypothetical protein ACFE9R_05200 [Candidatus Hermodarchaeota archaeon]
MNSPKQKKILLLTIGLICLISVNFYFSVIGANSNKDFTILDDNTNISGNLKTSDNGLPSLNYSAFYQNSSSVYRLLESVEFVVNTASFPDTNYSILQIDYSDYTNENLLMEYVSGTHNFTYIYTPRYNAPLGFHNVSFLMYDIGDTLLSSDVPITNFTVNSNYLLTLNSSNYYKDNTVYGELIVSDEPAPYNFNWNITVVDNDNETLQTNLFHVANDVQQFSFKVDERFEFSNKEYLIKLNLSDPIHNIRVPAYFPFTVLNSDPQIEVSSVVFSSYTIKRMEECTVNLNVSDIDFNTVPENLTTSITIKDSLGISQTPISLTNNNNWSFTGVFSIASSKPIGRYEVTIELEDQYSGTDSYSTTITVQNNPPKINGYTINGYSMEQSVEVDYGDDIIFAFNVSDVENSISYISVHLLNEDDEWYNLTKPYIPNMEFIIRTGELLTGMWLVYISVTDADGATTYLTSDINLGPQELRIIPDLLTPVLPWIAFVVGLIIGLLGAIGILYRKFKSKYEDTKEPTPKKPTIEKKTKKEQKEVKETKEPEEKEPTESKESEETTQIAQRRIKRKLK